MSNFREISPLEVENAIKLIGKDWMLVTAKSGDKINTMTANWGCMGFLWYRNICVVFVRPQRYTYEFTESSDKLSLSFFDEEYREALRFCGTRSGRDFDKFKETGLSASMDGDTPIIDQAKLVLECKKLYADNIKEEGFLSPELLDIYKEKDYHRVYICEIEKALVRE